MSAAAFRNRARVGRSIAAVRRARGWTQETFAEKLTVSVRYIQAVEAGDENLTLDSLTNLAQRLGLSLEALLWEAFAPTAPPTPTGAGASGYAPLPEQTAAGRAADEAPAPRRRSHPGQPPSKSNRGRKGSRGDGNG